jgi:hypothetical protein
MSHDLAAAAVPTQLSFTGAGAPPPARAFADASPRIRLSSARHSRGRSLPFLPVLPCARGILIVTMQ